MRSRPSLFDAERCTAAALKNSRKLYEGQAGALGDYFLMSLPSWVADEASRVNWRVDVGDREEVPFAVSDPFANHAKGSQEDSDQL